MVGKSRKLDTVTNGTMIQLYTVLHCVGKHDGTMLTRRNLVFGTLLRSGKILAISREINTEQHPFSPMTTTANEHSSSLGSSVNEKVLHSEPAAPLSHLLHSAFGLDHYPDYLSRWKISEIENLESTLEAKLCQVREQKKAWIERAQVMKPVCAHAELLSKLPLSRILAPEICQALGAKKCATTAEDYARFIKNGVAFAPSPASIIALAENAADDGSDGTEADVYTIPIFCDTFCSELLDATDKISEASAASDNSVAQRLRERPLNLEACGFEWLSDILLHLIVRPLTAVAFPNETGRRMGSASGGGNDLDWKTAFLVGYGLEKTPGITRTSLIRHSDDSEVTLNICLGKVFAGGELVFGDIRGNSALATVHSGGGSGTRGAGGGGGGTGTGGGIAKSTKVAPRLGRALLHRGRQLHEVLPVVEGERFAMVLWARSLAGVRAHQCPCCWLNRRDQGRAVDCICGPKWN